MEHGSHFEYMLIVVSQDETCGDAVVAYEEIKTCYSQGTIIILASSEMSTLSGTQHSFLQLRPERDCGSRIHPRLARDCICCGIFMVLLEDEYRRSQPSHVHFSSYIRVLI
jgi:hypothetical protein